MISIKNLAKLNKLKNEVTSNISKGKQYLEENVDLESIGNNIQQGKSFIQDKVDINSIQKNINEGKSFVQENVINKVKNKINDINISQLVSASETDCEHDITHYFLIPNIKDKNEYLLLTHREIPKNIENKKIIKKRMFHLSSEEKLDVLKEKFLEDETNKNIKTKTISDDASEVLSSVANNIDKSNNLITQGLITIGSIACLVNPVTGIALIAGSFVPNITGEILSGFTKKAANLLKTEDNVKISKAEEKALKELQQIKPQIVFNTILFTIDKCLEDVDYNPLNSIFDKVEYSDLTIKVISSIYKEVLENESFLSKNKINSNLKEYLELDLT